MYMKNLVNNFKNLILYKSPTPKYQFSLTENSNNKNKQEKAPNIISSSLDTNIKYLKLRYNVQINSDVILREFNLNINNKVYKALIVCIDGMIDSNLVNNFLLRPLMQTNRSKGIKKFNFNGIEIKKNIKIDLKKYIHNILVPQNSIKEAKTLNESIIAVNSGNCALFVDTLDIAILVDVKGYKAREISNPSNEVVVRGSQEAFVEKLRTNTTMLRRLINNENLIFEKASVGKVSKTDVAICYLKNIANTNLVDEVKHRINNLDLDYIISSGQLEQLIQDNGNIAFPQVIATERPDKAANHILEGRVAIIVNGSPYALIVPGVFLDFLSSPEDLNLKHQYANLLKAVRFIAAFITLLLPGIYIAIINYHTELLPTELLFTIAAARNTVPFPTILEILIMEISFELLREAGLRVPAPFGSTIGIIGALILGEAAVSANLVSPILIIIVAITGICSFAIPDFSLSFSFRLFRFLYIILGYLCGLLGIASALFVQVGILSSLNSFGAPYFVPYAPVLLSNMTTTYFIKPIWEREKRADFLNTKRPDAENKISMKWKFWRKGLK